MQYTESILLSRLTGGPRSQFELLGNDAVSVHVPDFMHSLEKKGYAVFANEHWYITQFGREALEKYKRPSRKAKSMAQIRESYDGAELRYRVQRDGAYDFLKCPSRYGDSLVHRPV